MQEADGLEYWRAKYANNARDNCIYLREMMHRLVTQW